MLPSTDRALLRACLRHGRGHLAAAMASSMIRQLAFLAIPYLLGRAIDDGIVPGDLAALARWSGMLAVAVVVEFLGLCGWTWWANRAEADLAADLRESLLDSVLTARSADLDRVTDGHGDLLERAIDDVEAVQIWLHGLATWVVIGTTVVVLIPAIGSIDPRLLLVAAGCVVVLAVVSVVFPRLDDPRMSRLARSQGRRSQAVGELVSAILTVRGLGSEPTLVRRHHERSADLTCALLDVARLRSAWQASAEGVPQFAIAVGLLVGVLAALNGELEVGQLATFALWMGTVQRATVAATDRLGDWNAARVSAARIVEVLNAAGPPNPPGQRLESEAVPPRTTDEPGPPALVVSDLAVDRVDTALSLRLALGQWGVLIGPTGSGKSTMLAAVAGLVESRGRVTWGSSELDGRTAEERSATLTLVTQKPLLLHGTLRDNLLLAAPQDGPEPTDAELAEVCRIAAAEKLLTELPDGLDTMIGERGLTLSGGQRARIALARALLRPGPILLLDDPTAALDPGTEQLVIERLRAATADRVVLWASHRPAVAARADQLVDLAGARARGARA
ncbi:MAG: ABC transporter ATP-binding protein [Microlunatus sp.]